MRRRGGGGEEYRGKKKEYKNLCKLKTEEENRRWKRMTKEAKQEGQVWKVMRRKKKRRKQVSKDIEMEEWKEYFRDLLGGVKEKMVLGRRKGVRSEGEEEEKG